MNKAATWALVAALAGFLFGFDTAVISGAEQAVQRVWDMSPALHGFAISSALWGTVVGAVFGGWPMDRWGRRATLIAQRANCNPGTAYRLDIHLQGDDETVFVDV